MKILKTGLILVLCISLISCSGRQAKIPVIYQFSTIQALMNGQLEGKLSFKELKKHGNTGMGTFEGLDGEMIELDNHFYQIKADGSVNKVKDTLKTPFATVIYFHPVQEQNVSESMTLKQFTDKLEKETKAENSFYVIKITGLFSTMKTRSVPKQEKPYPGLAEVVKKQSVFDFDNIQGTVVGFKMPKYIGGVNAPGFHFHFISKDKKNGGHVLDMKIAKVKVEIEPIKKIKITLN
ncbi:MAG: acetolactate decarboxylase [Candidatus Margulisbacteria bacterium]|nr:acetolactate decarboxylase [Candidatus Margulisiibacteriota bacterium]